MIKIILKFVIKIFFYIIYILHTLLGIFLIIRIFPVDFTRIGGAYTLIWGQLIRGNQKKRNTTLDIYFYYRSKKICNYFWYNKLNKYIYEGFLVYFLLLYYRFLKENIRNKKFLIDNLCIPINSKDYFLCKNNANSKNNIKYNNNLKKIVNSEKKLFDLSLDEINTGNKYLDKYKIDNKNFICLHNRDNYYLNKNFPTIDWSYHNYRDSKIEDYEKTSFWLENNNFKVLRMGKGTSKEISYKSKNIIDYANSNETSDLLDIFLLKNCKFLISSDTGITIVPEIFDVPILYTNWILIHRLPRYCRNCIVIFKKIYSNNKKRFLNLTEMIELDLGPQNSLDIIKNNNLKIIDNSPNEILDATIELNKRIEGIWKSSNEEDDLQNKFWNIFGKNYYRSQNFFIGTNFLKENSNLFFD